MGLLLALVLLLLFVVIFPRAAMLLFLVLFEVGMVGAVVLGIWLAHHAR